MTELPPTGQPTPGDPDAPVSINVQDWANLEKLGDRLRTGWKPGEIYLISAGVSTGKSLFMQKWREEELQRRLAQERDCPMCDAELEHNKRGEITGVWLDELGSHQLHNPRLIGARLGRQLGALSIQLRAAAQSMSDFAIAVTPKKPTNTPHGPQRQGKGGKVKRW